LYFINSLNAAVHVFPVKKEEKEKEKRSNDVELFDFRKHAAKFSTNTRSENRIAPVILLFPSI